MALRCSTATCTASSGSSAASRSISSPSSFGALYESYCMQRHARIEERTHTSQMPAWHLEHSITDRAEQIACLTCLTSSDLLVSRVIGPQPFVFSVIDRHQALRSCRPENKLFPHLFDPLQPTAEPTTWQTTNYAGASLDDDAQAGPESSCDKLQCTTLHTLAAGILPAALHTVIGPWIHRRRLSAHRKSNTAKPDSGLWYPPPPLPCTPW